MIHQNGLSEVDQYALRSIQCRVRRLIGRYGIGTDDREDLIQQLFLEYLERAGEFDASRGRYKTFVNCVVRNQLVSLIRRRKRQLEERVLCPLPPIPPDDPEQETPSRTEFSEDAYRIAAGLATHPAADLLDLRIDVNRAVQCLPAELREVACRVVEEGVRNVSEALGRSPARVYQLLWKMRPVFTEFGLARAAGGVR